MRTFLFSAPESLRATSSGQLCGHYEGLQKDAAGFYWFRSCSNGKAVKNFSKYGIIDGAIVMELE